MPPKQDEEGNLDEIPENLRAVIQKIIDRKVVDRIAEEMEELKAQVKERLQEQKLQNQNHLDQVLTKQPNLKPRVQKDLDAYGYPPNYYHQGYYGGYPNNNFYGNWGYGGNPYGQGYGYGHTPYVGDLRST